MFRRGLPRAPTGVVACSPYNSVTSTPLMWCASRQVANLNKDARDDLTRNFNKVKEEAKGQALDLADMCDAARATHKALQDANGRHKVDDKTFRAKLTTLNATFKAYNSRLNSLQNEAKAIQNDTEKLLKLLWSQDGASSTASTTTETKTSTAPTDDEEIAIDEPEKPASAGSSSSSSDSSTAYTTKVKVVEAEVVEEKPVTSNEEPAETSSSSAAPDVEVELEVETTEADPVEEMSITDITQELHEKDISFSDCLDAKSLRKRYREYKDGKVSAPKAETKAETKQQSQAPPRAEPHTQQDANKGRDYADPKYQNFVRDYQSQGQGPANTTETGVAAQDPNLQKHQMDPMALVGEVKEQVSKQHNVSPSMIDLYCGAVLMEDHKRLYEYPGLARGDRIDAVAKGQRPPGV